MGMWKKLLKAAKLARSAHSEQKRSHGTPYYKHPMAVARILWNQGYRYSDLITAAFLHDIVEDTDVSLKTLSEEFGTGVAELVSRVTKRKGEGYDAYYARVRAGGPLAMALKVADREHNNSEVHLAHFLIQAKAAKKTAAMRRAFSESNEEERIQALEAEGMTRSDAQAVYDAENMRKNNS